MDKHYHIWLHEDVAPYRPTEYKTSVVTKAEAIEYMGDCYEETDLWNIDYLYDPKGNGTHLNEEGVREWGPEPATVAYKKAKVDNLRYYLRGVIKQGQQDINLYYPDDMDSREQDAIQEQDAIHYERQLVERLLDVLQKEENILFNPMEKRGG